MWQVFDSLVSSEHGCMLVVADDAATEATRLSQQGTPIKPPLLTPELFRRVSRIDGTVLADPNGICHAIGVILDGTANDDCTPARGSRFNSGVRYVNGASTRRLAIVVSDDRTVDVFPMLRPRISRAELESHIAALEACILDTPTRTAAGWTTTGSTWMRASTSASIQL